MMKVMKGVCFPFSETGTEGGWWAMQEDDFVTEDGYWRYEACNTWRKAMTSRCLPKMEAFFGMASFTEIPQLGGFRVR
jgi:hypothetical protein